VQHHLVAFVDELARRSAAQAMSATAASSRGLAPCRICNPAAA
jgi:hypothetical protein